MDELRFKDGLKDAIPIFLGYLAVSVTFGVATVAYGFPSWVPIVISFSNYTGAGQALGVQLLASASTTLAELALAMTIINLRYSLMGISVSQSLSPKVTFWQRFVLAFGITDENFAVAVSRKKEITFSYMFGVELTAFTGWVAGTVLGAVLGNVFPETVMTAFGIALPAMFVAIIIPPCRTSPRVLAVVVMGTALSCLFFYVPGLRELSKGWVYIICGTISAVAGALIFPVKEETQ